MVDERSEKSRRGTNQGGGSQGATKEESRSEEGSLKFHVSKQLYQYQHHVILSASNSQFTSTVNRTKANVAIIPDEYQRGV